MTDQTSTTEGPAAATEADLDAFLGATDAPRWHRWVKWGGGGVALLLLLLLLARCFGGGETGGYITQEVRRGNLAITVSATGNLAPTNQVEVGSELSGTIDQVLVDVNDRVARGQPLAVINTDILDDQIAQGQAALNARRAEVQQAKATLAEAQAQLNRMQEVSRLSDGRVPSQTEMASAEATRARAVAQLRAAEANAVSAQASLSSSMTNRGKAVIRAPVSGIVLSRQIEPGQTVAASFSTPTLFVIAEDLSSMQLEIAIDEADVGQVKAGQEATFTVDAWPGETFPAKIQRVDLGSNNLASSSSSSSVSTSSQVIAYDAILSVSNPDGRLRPGMTATADIAVQSAENVLIVPNAALRFRPDNGDTSEETQGGLMTQMGPPGRRMNEGNGQQTEIGAGSQQTVYILDDKEKLRAIPVVTGASDGRDTAVTSSELKPGMKVVTSVKAATE
ncbi:efflux transporter periplasmic adaptor subunit [Croceicoccus estronivorus]|uniref:efflux RND transporter periplasmic adaptor subunit n=1 Tax=Croceicoccus estronivorus TaxID=1172626 RepID=UPI00082FD57A|nr:efflux RND transporter periplasmic adaptor subunit [Croceicoccus estronivorus]OCC25042.1 efflux transporter periplasmic adaptor subunit [Croceicoccus estronivorus]